MALSWEDVVNKQFQPTKFREGYDQTEVDDFLDEIVAEFKRLIALNEQLESENAELRAGGAGIPASFTATGVGTLVAEGKEVRTFDGRDYVLETGLVADLSIVKAWKADERGNLVFRKTARNFNPMMATAGKVTLVEVEEIVPVGSLDPDHIHTPGIYVDRLIQTVSEKRIEQRTVRQREPGSSSEAVAQGENA